MLAVGISLGLVKSGRPHSNAALNHPVSGEALERKRRVLHFPQCKWEQKEKYETELCQVAFGEHAAQNR